MIKRSEERIEVTIDLAQAQKLQDQISDIFVGEKAIDSLIAMTMAIIGMSVNIEQSFESTILEMQSMEKLLKVKQ